MRNNPEPQCGPANLAGLQCTSGEILLRCEISFWRELLASSEGVQPPEAVDRMRQALALAEYRLLSLCRPAH